MAETPSWVLRELSGHLQKVHEDLTTPLNTELLDKCEIYTNTPEYRTEVWKETRPLFLQLAALLPNIQQDPSSLTRFIVKLAEPYRFEDIKDVDFEVGLSLEATAFHGLILTLLEKATRTSNDAQVLANRPTVMYAIVRLWLCTQDSGVSSQANELLISLLRISKDEPGPAPEDQQQYHYGSGPVWKRLFHDRDIYSLYYQHTTFSNLKRTAEPALTKRDRTIAQARLLDFLPRVGTLDWTIITSSHESEIEQQVGIDPGQGLLHYATSKMVDTADDMLMHMTLINFFGDLITTVTDVSHPTPNHSSLSLDFLKEQGIHKQIIDFHTTESPGLEHSFLSNRTAHYISEYASTYPVNFESSAELSVIRQYVHRNIRSCSANDLSVLASMPRATLIPQRAGKVAWDEAIILDVPVTRTNPDALKTLATIFHGPAKKELTFPKPIISDLSRNRTTTEKVFARLLLALYYTKKPTLFTDLVKHAELIAMKENALAALTLMRAIITSEWDSQPLPNIIPETDPVYQRLHQFPKTGVDALIDPSISGVVLPYLMRPATTYSNLVGGRGDAENAAYQIAMAKFDVVQALSQRLEKQVGARQDVLAMVRRRVAEGPWGEGGGAGSRIGTLEL